MTTTAVSLHVTVVGSTTLPGGDGRWALAVGRLPDVASVVRKGEPRTGLGSAASPETVAAWARTAQAVARERSLWCESAADQGRMVLLVLPFGLVPGAHHRVPRGALCFACEPPAFSPVALSPAATEAVLRAALAAVVPGKDRGVDLVGQRKSDAAIRAFLVRRQAAPRPSGREEDIAVPDAWVPISNWAGVPVDGERVVGVCTDTASFCEQYADGDWDLELPDMQARNEAMDAALRGPEAELLPKKRAVEETTDSIELMCSRCLPKGGGCRAGRPAFMVDVPYLKTRPPPRGRQLIHRVAEPAD